MKSPFAPLQPDIVNHMQGPFRRVVLPALLGVAAWLVFWLVDNISLQSLLLGGLEGIDDGQLVWYQVPALVLLPRFGWLLFPVLFLCVHLCATAGGRAAERVIVAGAPLVLAPLVYWKSLNGLLEIATPVGWEAELIYDVHWRIAFFAPEFTALVLTCMGALLLYLIAERTMQGRLPSDPG